MSEGCRRRRGERRTRSSVPDQPAFAQPNAVDAQPRLVTRVCGLCGAPSPAEQILSCTVLDGWMDGWMEGGLHASLAKMVIDADLLHMVTNYLQPLDFSEDALAVDAIAGVGAGGHFFGEAHTQDRYTDAFYSPLVSDWRNWESWTGAGGPRGEGASGDHRSGAARGL